MTDVIWRHRQAEQTELWYKAVMEEEVECMRVTQRAYKLKNIHILVYKC